MRLIDRDALLKHQRKMRGFELSPEDEFWDYAVLAEDIQNAPTVDAVPVVRCKDCKHFNSHERECENDAVSTDHEGGASYSLNFDLDDFCSYGERRDENGEMA